MQRKHTHKKGETKTSLTSAVLTMYGMTAGYADCTRDSTVLDPYRMHSVCDRRLASSMLSTVYLTGGRTMRNEVKLAVYDDTMMTRKRPQPVRRIFPARPVGDTYVSACARSPNAWKVALGRVREITSSLGAPTTRRSTLSIM